MKLRTLSGPLQKKAEKELNEVPNQVEENLENLRSWLSKQEHIKYKDDDQLLVNFLRGSKFSIQRSKEKLDAYYTFRTFAPEFAGNLDPFQHDIQAFLKMGMAVPLPTPKDDPASARVFLMSLQNYNPDEITMSTILKHGSISVNILLNEDDNFVVSGAKVIWDFKGMQLKTALQSTPDLMRKTAYCYQQAYPTRLKALYFINVPSFFENVLNVAKKLFSKKLANRLHFYSNDNLEHIYKDIPQSILPKEYGGDAGPLADLAAKWKQTVESHAKRLLEENNYYTDESKRPGKPISEESLYGIDGSFRKLNID